MFLCGLHSLYFILDSEDSYFSISLIVLIVALVLVNMVVIFGNLIRHECKRCKSKKAKKKMLKNLKSQKYEEGDEEGDIESRQRSNATWALNRRARFNELNGVKTQSQLLSVGDTPQRVVVLNEEKKEEVPMFEVSGPT